MAVAIETVSGTHVERTSLYRLPAKVHLNGSSAAVRSTIEEGSSPLTLDELSMIHYGIELGPEVNGHKNETARAWGFYTRESEDPEVYIVGYKKKGANTRLEGRIRVTGSPYSPEIELFDASRVDQADTQA